MQKLFVSLLFFFAMNNIHSQPSWLWGKYGGSGDANEPVKITNDHEGNVYMAGKFTGNQMTFYSFNATNISGVGSDLYIVKFNSAGTVKWLKAVGANSGNVDVKGIDCDSSGNVYVGGTFNGNKLIFGNDTLNSDHYSQGFIAKYDSSGTALWGKTYFSSPGNVWTDGIYNMDVDANGNIYIAGQFDGPQISIDTITLSHNSNHQHMFCARLNTNGQVYWAKYGGSLGFNSGSANATDATIDEFGNFYIAGNYNGIAYFDNTLLPVINNYGNFLAKYNINGIFQWVQCWRSNVASEIRSMTCDHTGNVFVGGVYSGDTLFVGNQTFLNQGELDMNILKYSPSGTLLWAKASGGNHDEEPLGMCTDVNGDLYVTGQFSSDSIDWNNHKIVNPVFGGVGGPVKSFFLTNISASGNLNWLIPADDEYGPAYGIDVSLDNTGALYVAGMNNNQALFGTITIPQLAGGYTSFLLKSGTVTEISNISGINSLKLFPNPSNGILNVVSEKNFLSISIYDFTGKQIFQTTDNTSQIFINEKGIYRLVIRTNDGIESRSFINIR